MMRTNAFNRAAALGTGVALACMVAGCASSAEPDEGNQPPQQTQAAGPQINDPKDAAAPPRCNLLPPEAATSMGLDPQGEEEADPIDPSAPSSCTWQDSGPKSVALTPLSDRSIQSYYDNKSQYVDFKELNIGGHPAVQANKGDPTQDGFCDIFLATNENQVLAAQSHISGEVRDPCALSRQALEASVPTLPAAK